MAAFGGFQRGPNLFDSNSSCIWKKKISYITLASLIKLNTTTYESTLEACSWHILYLRAPSSIGILDFSFNVLRVSLAQSWKEWFVVTVFCLQCRMQLPFRHLKSPEIISSHSCGRELMANFQTYISQIFFQLIYYCILKTYASHDSIKLKLKLLYWNFQKYKTDQYSVKVMCFSQT